MTTPVHALAIAGSLRAHSYNRAVLRAAAELAPAGLTLEPCDLRPIPLYDGDVEAIGWPEAVVALRQRIAAADALLIATPEYNHSVPGVLKNAIDWVSRPPAQPLAGKPVAILGATTGAFGTVRAQAHLRQTLVGLGMLPLGKPDVLIASAQERFDGTGRLVDEPTRQMIAGLLEALLHWVRRLRGA